MDTFEKFILFCLAAICFSGAITLLTIAIWIIGGMAGWWIVQ